MDDDSMSTKKNYKIVGKMFKRTLPETLKHLVILACYVWFQKISINLENNELNGYFHKDSELPTYNYHSSNALCFYILAIFCIL